MMTHASRAYELSLRVTSQKNHVAFNNYVQCYIYQMRNQRDVRGIDVWTGVLDALDRLKRNHNPSGLNPFRKETTNEALNALRQLPKLHEDVPVLTFRLQEHEEYWQGENKDMGGDDNNDDDDESFSSRSTGGGSSRPARITDAPVSIPLSTVSEQDWQLFWRELQLSDAEQCGNCALNKLFANGGFECECSLRSAVPRCREWL
eukprot:gb/GECG01015175.1/.p1 GENE.gb/GECG01015175.1/~~gb/GECG01015175.1/.p1  ORF type:complete len:204 (+),score=18.32 gb/GECG01015175.1/:1-612(+)